MLALPLKGVRLEIRPNVETILSSKDRITDLALLLKSGKRNLTRKYLETRWNCSTPTVHRVISRSRDGGIPIIFEAGYYQLDKKGKSFEVPGLWFTADELAALLGLARWLEVLASGVLKEKLTPIHARMEKMLQQQGLDPIEWKDRIRLLPMHHRPIDLEILVASARAVLKRNRTSFLYAGVKDSQARKREVSPQTLVHYRDNWYLDGFDHDTGKLREFALSRIKDFKVHPKPAKEIPRNVLDSHFGEAYGIFAGRARRNAVLVFEGLAAKLVGDERWHPLQKSSLLPGGKVKLEFPCANVRELARDVMRFIDEVTVEGPEELSLEVEGLLRRAWNRLDRRRESV